MVSSCVEKEFFEPAPKVEKDTPVVFTATPKGFTKANVGTRAGEEEDDGSFDATRFENTIYNAFFLLFDNNGLLRIKGKAVINEEGVVSYNVGRDVLSIFPSFRICFLANVQESVYNGLTVNTTTWSDMEGSYLTVSYAQATETGCVGVPRKADLNGDGTEEYAMPMFESKVVNAPYNSAEDYYSFQLRRMFTRVEVLLSLGIQDDGNLLTSIPQFSLVECTFNNIPTQVPIVAQSGATACADLSNSEASSKLTTETLSSYNLTADLGRILYYSSATNPDYRSFYCYIPEHKLGDCGANTVQSNKPTLVDGTTKRPAYVSISGFIVDRQGTSYDAKYNIYLGENETNNFDLSRNKLYRNYIRINGVNSADHRVEKMEEVKEIIQDVTRTGQAANCYIITTTGTYMLPAYKGAFNNLANAEMCAIGTNELIACDNPNINITFNEALSKQSTIVFTVTNSSDLLSGNAVIARRNASGEIEWSWHLWFIPGLEWNAGSSGDLGSTNRIGGLLNSEMYDGTDMADRNLGVNASLYDLSTWMPSTIIGTYYKYGHRNPYIEDKKYSNGAAYHCLDNDDYEVWSGSSKSRTDPCPPGYRVPPQTVWEGSNAQNATMEHYSGLFGIQVDAFRYWNRGLASVLIITDDIYYPYGYMTSSGVFSDGTKNYDFTLSGNITEETETDVTEEWSEGWLIQTNYRKIEYTETSYSGLQYQVLLDCHEGGLHTQTSGLYFGFNYSVVNRDYFSSQVKFKSCTKKSYKVSVNQRQGLFGWSDVSGTESRTLTFDGVITTEPEMNTDWREEAIEEQFGWSSQKTILEGKNTPSNPDHGYQVRCIVELAR